MISRNRDEPGAYRTPAARSRWISGGLAAELRRHLTNEPLKTDTPTPAYHVSKLIRCHRTATVGIGGTGGFTGRGRRDRCRLRDPHGVSEPAGRPRARTLQATAWFRDGPAPRDRPSIARGQDRALLLCMLMDAIDGLAPNPPSSEQINCEISMLLVDSLIRLGVYERALAQVVDEEQAAEHVTSSKFVDISASIRGMIPPAPGPRHPLAPEGWCSTRAFGVPMIGVRDGSDRHERTKTRVETPTGIGAPLLPLGHSVPSVRCLLAAQARTRDESTPGQPRDSGSSARRSRSHMRLRSDQA